jgi:ubiquitin-conjugating enzyme E2 Q
MGIKRLIRDLSFVGIPIIDTTLTDFRPGSLDVSAIPRLAPPSWATSIGLRALGLEVKKLQAVQAKTPLHELGWYIDFNGLTNLFQWIVELHTFDPTVPFARDMKEAGITSIVLEIRFGKEFPVSPPFVRVVRPRFLPFISGGGGHVTGGGAMCMELLTNSGWSPANSMESVLVQVRLALCNLEPRPARLLKFPKGSTAYDYSLQDAVTAYTRAVNTHGWKIPDDLKVIAKQ